MILMCVLMSYDRPIHLVIIQIKSSKGVLIEQFCLKDSTTALEASVKPYFSQYLARRSVHLHQTMERLTNQTLLQMYCLEQLRTNGKKSLEHQLHI